MHGAAAVQQLATVLFKLSLKLSDAYPTNKRCHLYQLTQMQEPGVNVAVTILRWGVEAEHRSAAPDTCQNLTTLRGSDPPRSILIQGGRLKSRSREIKATKSLTDTTQA